MKSSAMKVHEGFASRSGTPTGRTGKRTGWLRILITGTVLATGFGSPALALRCGSRTVSVGDRKIEVVARCGEPSWKEERAEETEERVFGSGERRALLDDRRAVTTIEEWVHNFGPNRLLYVFVFENGKVVDVKTLGYGF